MANNSVKNNLKGPLFLSGAFGLAGTSVIAAEMLSGKLGNFSITAFSLLLAFLCLAPLCLKGLIGAVRRMRAREWFLVILQAVCGIFIYRVLLLQGLLRTSAGEAGILTGAIPAVTAILAWAVLRESINQWRLAGIICTICGVLIIQGLLKSGGQFSGEHFSGNLLVLGAAVSESVFNVLSRTASSHNAPNRTETAGPLVQTTLVTLTAFLFCLIPALFEHPGSTLSQIGLIEWLALAWYGPVVTAAGFVFWYAGISRCPVSIAAAFSGLMPLVALVLSIWLFNEDCGWRQWSGGILVILGMILVGSSRTTFKKSRNAEQRV